MTISPLPLTDVSGVPSTWPDDVADLTDRRRILVLAVLGVDVPRQLADTVFSTGQSSSMTSRSAGREPSTDAT